MKEEDKITEKDKYVKDLFEDLKDSLTKFDSQSLALSGGALGFSLTFLQEIVPYEKSTWTGFFYVSLFLFLYTITIGFIGHYLSAKHSENSIGLVRNNMVDKIKPDKLIPRLNLSIVIALPLGILSLIVFCIRNIENHKKGNSDSLKKSGQIHISKQVDSTSNFHIEGDLKCFFYIDSAKTILKYNHNE